MLGGLQISAAVFDAFDRPRGLAQCIKFVQRIQRALQGFQNLVGLAQAFMFQLQPGKLIFLEVEFIQFAELIGQQVFAVTRLRQTLLQRLDLC